MTTIPGIYMIVLAIAVVIIMLRDHHRGSCELVSVRNVALVGFIIFQLTSAAMTLLRDVWAPYFVSNALKTSIEYSAMCTLFLATLLWAYRRGWVVNRLAAKLPSTSASLGDSALLAMALLVTGLAVLMRISIQVPVIGPAAVEIATGLGAVACGMVGWVWAKRMFNPAVILYAGFVFMVNVGVVMYGSFGRRGLVALGAGLLWGGFYSRWRYLPLRVFLKRLVLVAAGPTIILALFTSVRSSGEMSRSTSEHFDAIMSGGHFSEGMIALLDGQGTGAASMWLAESHREGTFEPRHMFTILNFFYYPVPKMFWTEKPLPLGKIMPHMAHMTGVDRNKLTVGPGIIGSAAAEGGWYAILVYAIVGGLFLRFFDEAIRLHPYSPFFVIPIGASLGQILGLARGETSAFAFLACMSIGGSLLLMVTIGKFVERAGPSLEYVPDALEEDEADSGDEESGEDQWDSYEPDLESQPVNR